MVGCRAGAPAKGVVANIRVGATGEVNNLMLSNSARVYEKQRLDLLDLCVTHTK